MRAEHEVDLAANGPDAVRAARASHFDLIVLDIGLPGFDGFEVLQQLGPAELRPRVLMLTSRGEVADRVQGLKAGADDYLVKPFAMEELVARIDALGRRAVAHIAAAADGLGMVLDAVRRRVVAGADAVELSPRECELLQVFLMEPGRVFSRSELFERIWGRAHTYDSKTVETFIMRLRRKLEEPKLPAQIETVRGVGYTLRARSAACSARQP